MTRIGGDFRGFFRENPEKSVVSTSCVSHPTTFVGHFTCAIMRCDIVTIDHLAIDRVEAVGLP